MESSIPSFPSLRKQVISLDISLISYQNALKRVIELAKKRRSSYACFSNAHMTIEAHQSNRFAEMVNKANFTFADGMPLVFALRFLYGIRQDRIAGMDFMGDVMKLCEANGLSVFLFGSTSKVLEKLKVNISINFPRLKIAGSISPPFGVVSEEENKAMIEEINASAANIIFVGLGCPKQETWMAKNSNLIQGCLLGVGGAFSIYAGEATRAPRWMQRFGLEWVYRLSQEPSRLLRRYALTNSQFVYLFIRQFFLNGNKRNS